MKRVSAGLGLVDDAGTARLDEARAEFFSLVPIRLTDPNRKTLSVAHAVLG
ncbi:MAG: hypothetical protein GY948_05625 [Alphaproteobacteria bacterium]|nr:hypothetical protein [Alphaproteobacteria bacterium]